MRKLYVMDELDSVSADELTAAIDSLPQWRREKAVRFKFEQGKKECAFSYLLLCRGLDEMYGIKDKPMFEYGQHGKPVIAGRQDIHFNFSHCKNAIACVLSDKDVGVDVERVGRFNDDLARYVLSDDEYNCVVSSSAPDQEFTKYWTMKEALLKLTGDGLTDDVKSVLSKYSNVVFETNVNKEKGYVLSIAEYVD